MVMRDVRGEHERIGRCTSPIALGLIAFAIFGCATLIAAWHIVEATGYEISDFAANSILIQSAKHGTLTLGNYSRVGFNHPGPAILYILAAGEWLFHDRLGWVTPVGGQIVAACLYNAAWLGLAVAILRSMGLDAARCLLTICVAAAIVAVREPRSFDSLWFPYLYVMPFLAFTVSLAATARSDGPEWIWLAIAAGFLVNGHVSFVGVCGIAIVITVTLRLVTHGLRGGTWMVAGGATFALFLVPFAVRELRHRPGPFEEYAAFAGTNAAHGIGESLRFIGHHVATTALEFALVAAAVVALLARRANSINVFLLIAIGSTSLGATYYVVKGVDALSYDYVLLFFGAVPALTLGAGLVSAVSATARPWAILAPAAVALAVWSAAVHADAPWPAYNAPEIAALDNSMTKLGPSRFALDIVDTHDLNAVWSAVLGVEAKRVREGRPLGFCVDRGWNVSYTAMAKCGPSDDAAAHYLVDVAGASRSKDFSLAVSSAGLDFLRPEGGCLAPGERFTADDSPIRMAHTLRTGWSPLEGSFSWSSARQVTLSLCTNADVETLVLDLRAFAWPDGAVGGAEISAGGPISDVRFDSEQPRRTVEVHVPTDHPREVTISITIHGAISPAALGLSADSRTLGVALYGIAAR